LFESRIAGIIASVLSISRATVDHQASFQELGGSSLDAIVVASNLRKINIHISVSDILQSSSIREIAACRTELNLAEAAPPPPFSLLPEGAELNLARLEDAYPVTPLQEGVIVDAVLGNINYVYQRIYKLQGVSSSQVHSAVEAVLARNTILRTSFLLWKKSFLQVVKPTATLPETLVKGKSLDSLLRDLSRKDMPINGPLVRAAVLDDEILVLEMHHALFDFWSSQFIIEDTIAILKGNHTISRLPFSSYIAY
jgi:acyl carrier protein